MFGESLRPMCDLEPESWKPVPGFEKYLVSDLGRVRTIAFRHPTPIMAQRCYWANPYLAVTFTAGEARHQKDVHRLVALAFCERPDGKNYVNHINGNKHDNRAVNLEWVSASENHKHAREVLGVDYGAARRKAVACRPKGSAFWCVFRSARSAEVFGFASPHIAACVKGKKKTHKGMEWKYAE